MSGRVRLKEDGVLDEDLPTLQEIVFNYLSRNLWVLCEPQHIPGTPQRFRSDVVLPSVICDKFLEIYQKNNCNVDDDIAILFSNVEKTPLKFVHLRNSTIKISGLELLLQHNLISLSMWYCEEINPEARLALVKEYCANLKNLEIGMNIESLDKICLDFQFNCPQLKRLVLHNVALHYRSQLNHLQYLSYLDLSSSTLTDFNLDPLCNLPNLKTLILFDVWPVANKFHAVCQIKQLQYLDISVSSSSNGHGTYDWSNQTLRILVENLPNLTHLDISGTNLAGTGVAQKELGNDKRALASDIPGLTSRIDRPLQFLGLYHTSHYACKRHDIPAIQIAGDANENQILTAALYYQDRPVVLTRVLNDLYHLFRFESCKNVHTALDIVLTAMDRHLKFKHMQISGSATLFYIVKGREKNKFGTSLKNHIIRTLLNGMEDHKADDTMLRNGYLTLCQFSMPNDVLFEYNRLIRILLHGVAKTEQEGFVQRIAIYLLNTLACQVDGQQKLFLGDMGVIKTMLNLIKDRLNRSVFDDVMEVAWSTMWNVTDETAINCKRFLDDEGMEYFLRCLNSFPEKEELLRNMMGLLGNVAEVKWLRQRLMTEEFVTVFSTLLESVSDGIEVSYNAAGVLAHIASDGESAWTIKCPSRAEVLFRMVNAIERWNLNSERNINYRSFEPILGLVRYYETPECQHWAVWALANLTKVYPEKYCRLVEQENGIKILSELINDPRPYSRIKDLAHMVIERCFVVKAQSNNLEG